LSELDHATLYVVYENVPQDHSEQLRQALSSIGHHGIFDVGLQPLGNVLLALKNRIGSLTDEQDQDDLDDQFSDYDSSLTHAAETILSRAPHDETPVDEEIRQRFGRPEAQDGDEESLLRDMPIGNETQMHQPYILPGKLTEEIDESSAEATRRSRHSPERSNRRRPTSIINQQRWQNATVWLDEYAENIVYGYREPQDNKYPVSNDQHDVQMGISHNANDTWIMAGASIRGRTHQNAGTYRDDAFALRQVGPWNIMAISDGAGSAKYSRVTSNESHLMPSDIDAMTSMPHRTPSRPLWKTLCFACIVNRQRQLSVWVATSAIHIARSWCWFTSRCMTGAVSSGPSTLVTA
jgi:hypothetical protein